MGREAYLARLALGISAFQEPLRDDNHEFVLGGQAHKFDDISYRQQWNERGHPQNLASERHAKRFYKSQNEILQACGLVVRKNAEKKRRRKRDQLSDSAQQKSVEEENEIGFVLKYVDNMAGDLLTWWICNLKKRLLVFRPPRSTMLEIIKAGLLSSTAMSFLFGGFSAYSIDSLLATMRDTTSDDTKYVDFLETRTRDTPSSWREEVETWIKWAIFMSVEMPLSMMSTLQNLGFTIGPVILAYLKRSGSDQGDLMPALSKTVVIRSLAGLIFLYLVHGRIYDEVFWRSYIFLRQVLPRPRNPSKMSIQAAENDEFDESETITGIGRALGSCTDRRFYGPQSFWPALEIAFPWVGYLTKKKFERDNIKQETLTRCAMMEDSQGFHDTQHRSLSVQRAENIISNLESLGIDVEEDFYVDIDQWSHEIEGIDTERIFEDALQLDVDHTANQNREIEDTTGVSNNEHPRNRSRSPAEPTTTEIANNMTSTTNGGISIEIQFMQDDTRNEHQDIRLAPVEVLSFPTSPQNEVSSTPQIPVTRSGIDVLSLTIEIDNIYRGTSFDDRPAEEAPEAQIVAVETADTNRGQHTPPAATIEWGQPLTPESGIRRATSLSHTQTTPRPIRRITETGNDTSVDSYLAQVLAGSRKIETKKKLRDDREARVTRLSVFASDSLAWHASSMIASLLLLPLNAVYYRRLAKGFLSMTEGLGSAVSIFPTEELRLVDSPYSWDQGRMVLVSLGIECLIHGVIWQVGCGVARYYGLRYHWGKF